MISRNDFFEKLSEVLGCKEVQITSKEDASFFFDTYFSWEQIDSALRNIISYPVVCNFPLSPSEKDGGRGYTVKTNPVWLITFSRFSFKEEHQLKCSIRTSRNYLKPSS